jgi:hypothetical protein
MKFVYQSAGEEYASFRHPLTTLPRSVYWLTPRGQGGTMRRLPLLLRSNSLKTVVVIVIVLSSCRKQPQHVLNVPEYQAARAARPVVPVNCTSTGQVFLPESSYIDLRMPPNATFIAIDPYIYSLYSNTWHKCQFGAECDDAHHPLLVKVTPLGKPPVDPDGGQRFEVAFEQQHTGRAAREYRLVLQYSMPGPSCTVSSTWGVSQGWANIGAMMIPPGKQLGPRRTYMAEPENSAQWDLCDDTENGQYDKCFPVKRLHMLVNYFPDQHDRSEGWWWRCGNERGQRRTCRQDIDYLP